MNAALQTFKLPSDPEKALLKTFEVICDLEHIYHDEIDAMKKSDTKAFLLLQDKKLQNAELYQSCVHQIMKRKAEMKDVNPDIKNMLKQKQAEFAELSRTNLNEIKRMQRAVSRLGETVRKATKDAAKRLRGVSYNEAGQMHNQEERTVSVAINETA